MVGVALNHESNGKVILFPKLEQNYHAGFERKNWTVYVETLVSYASSD
jgi:hypothetical protein